MSESPTVAELVAFLNGEASLDGRWFADDMYPRERYWWRKHLSTLTTQSALIETLTRERDGILAERNNLMASLAYTEAALADARDKALEEAALNCDMLLGEMSGEGSWGDYDAGLASAYDRCATNIRALKSALEVEDVRNRHSESTGGQG
jgi:hypothetical protein